MRYFVSFHVVTRSGSSFGNAVIDADGPVATWSDLQDLTGYVCEHMSRKMIKVKELTVINFIPLTTAPEG